jgi:hypothetical protein
MKYLLSLVFTVLACWALEGRVNLISFGIQLDKLIATCNICMVLQKYIVINIILYIGGASY